MMNKASDDAVVVDHLRVVRGGREVLPDLSLSVPRGQVVGLLGPSGGGKSTLMRAVVGVQVIAGGTVTVLGEQAGSPGLRHRVGYLTQAPSVYGDLSVRDNVGYIARVMGVGADAVDRAIGSVDLTDHAHVKVENLSGGQQSRASLACTLVGDPEVLVLDEPTVALMIVVPCVLLGLLAWIYADLPGDIFNRIGPALLGVFPFVVMFIVTSIATLRERTSGTLERLLTTPLGKGDLMLGYALAFGAMAVLQALVATGFAVWVCGLDIAGPLWLLVVVALFTALLGTALGLLASGFARTEFQAVQFMPALVLPQFLLCGLLVPRELLPPGLEAISNVLPLSYAVDAMKDVTVLADPLGEVLPSLGVIALWIAASLALGSLTLRRRTP